MFLKADNMFLAFKEFPVRIRNNSLSYEENLRIFGKQILIKPQQYSLFTFKNTGKHCFLNIKFILHTNKFF